MVTFTVAEDARSSALKRAKQRLIYFAVLAAVTLLAVGTFWLIEVPHIAWAFGVGFLVVDSALIWNFIAWNRIKSATHVLTVDENGVRAGEGAAVAFEQITKVTMEQENRRATVLRLTARDQKPVALQLDDYLGDKDIKQVRRTLAAAAQQHSFDFQRVKASKADSD